MEQPATTCRELFSLLVEGASAERIAHVAVTARAAGVSRAELAEIERATELALGLQRRFAQQQRREAELSALFDTAGDLAGLRDLNAVLRSIVHRARMLLGADTSYLSLNDEAAGDTYMRVTDGSISARFQRVRLGMGEGLGGLVAQSAQPYATANYLEDARFVHTSAIDTAVEEEGLVAILGVPLSLNAQVIGVLYTAFRSAREFAAEEVALLSSLADHAAIAIDTASLIDETRTALAELNSAHATIRAHNEAMRRAQQDHDRLTDLVLRGADVAEVAAAVAAMLEGGIVVHDSEGAELARIGVETAETAPPQAEAVATSRANGRAVAHEDHWVCAVLAGQELLGSLVLTGQPGLSGADRRLFERAGVVTALLLLQQRSVVEAENTVRGELVVDLLTAPGRDPAGIVARARRLGIDLTCQHAVLVAHAEGVSRERLTAAATHYARSTGGVAGALENQVLLLPGHEPGQAARAAARELGTVLGCPVNVGAAGPAAGPAELAAAATEANRCLRALGLLERQGVGASMADLGFLGVVLGQRSNTSDYVRSTLGPLLDYDAERGTDLVGTLRAYFANGTNLNRTKDALHVHVNTVAQRLDRIRALLGTDWQHPDRALEIQLALRLLHVTALITEDG